MLGKEGSFACLVLAVAEQI